MRLSIRWKIILPFVLLSLLAFVMLGVGSTPVIEQVLETEADAKLRDNAQSITRFIEQSRDSARLNANYVASLRNVKAVTANPSRTAVESVLSEAQATLDIQEVSFYTPDFQQGDAALYYGGPMITRRLQINEGAMRIRDNLILETLRTGSTHSGIAISPQSAQIIGTAPIFRSVDSQLTGVIVAVFYLDENYLTRIQDVLPVNLAIVKDNAIVASVLPTGAPIQKAIDAGFTGTNDNYNTLTFTDSNGEPQRLIAYPFELMDTQQGWLLVADSLSDLTAITRSIQTLALGLAVVIIAFSIALGWLLSKMLAQPLQELAAIANQIQRGNLHHRVKIPKRWLRDEISDLSANFNQMTQELEMLYTKLELRVWEKTRDLQVVGELTRNVTTTLDVDELLPKITRLARLGLNLSAVVIYLQEDDALSVAAYDIDSDYDDNLHRPRIGQKAEGLIETAAQHIKPLWQSSAQEATNSDLQDSPALPGTQSEIAMSMNVGVEFIGVIHLQSFDAERFDVSDLQTLSAFAGQIAVAIQNAHSYAHQVQIAEARQQADEMKSQFLASMSHELRTPLNAIINFTQFVASGMMGEVSDKQRDALNKSIISGKHLLGLINDILDISKITAGKLELFVQDVDVNEEVQAALDATDALMEGKDIERIVELDASLPIIEGDRRRLRQIFLNLISNAIKYTTEGQITVRTEHRPNLIQFTVSDTGPGIAKTDLEKIFQPFRQEESGLLHEEGTGLGLPISIRLAQAHEGDITVESTLGVGSTFKFTLPLRANITDEIILKENAHATH